MYVQEDWKKITLATPEVLTYRAHSKVPLKPLSTILPCGIDEGLPEKQNLKWINSTDLTATVSVTTLRQLDLFSFQSEWNVIVVKFFLSIISQSEFCLVHSQQENCQHNHIPCNVKEVRNINFTLVILVLFAGIIWLCSEFPAKISIENNEK